MKAKGKARRNPRPTLLAAASYVEIDSKVLEEAVKAAVVEEDEE